MNLASEFREIAVEQVEYRELLLQMTLRDLLLRYKQTVMGFGWALFMPLVNTVIFSVIFMRVAPVQTSVPYPLFAFSGLLAWNFFAASLRFATNSLTSNANLVSKVYFPREIFPISAVLVTLVDAVVGGVVLCAMMVYYDVAVTPALLLLPAVIGVLIAFTSAIAMALALANLFYRDVKYILEALITVWMFATSVVYPVELVGGRLALVLQFNPMVPIINAFRAVIIEGRLPEMGPFLGVALLSMAALAVTWITFHRAESKFAENI
jgi:ABC-type polysaccharide/polyol phosphate export permease